MASLPTMQAFSARASSMLSAKLSCVNRSIQKHVVKSSSYSTSTESAEPSPGETQRVFVGHSIYKGKAALSFRPGKPTFKKTETGYTQLEREGAMFFEFAVATGQRQYDWNRKQIIALSVTELGTLLALSSTESCEFFHDPYMASSNAGMVRKTLKVDAMPDKSGFFFNFSVVNKLENIDDKFMVPVTKGEFAVIKSGINYIIPYLMGWHVVTNPLFGAQNVMGQLNTVVGKINPLLEWSR